MPDLGDLFKDLVWDTIIRAALARLFAAIPFLGWGPIGLIVSWLVTKYAGMLYDQLHEAVDFQLIVFRKEKLRDQWATEVLSLKEIAINGAGVDSDDFKKQKELAKKTLSEFIAFNLLIPA